MKLKTLIEARECFKLLRNAEEARSQLSGADYVRCLSAQSMLNLELEKHLETLPAVEVEAS